MNRRPALLVLSLLLLAGRRRWSGAACAVSTDRSIDRAARLPVPPGVGLSRVAADLAAWASSATARLGVIRALDRRGGAGQSR